MAHSLATLVRFVEAPPMMVSLVFLVGMLSPTDVDRLLRAGKPDQAFRAFLSDTSLTPAKGRLYLQSFLASQRYDLFFKVLDTLRQRLNCPPCFSDLGWAAAARAKDPRRAFEEMLNRVWEGQRGSTSQGLWTMYHNLFRKSWKDVRIWAETWARRHGEAGWGVLVLFAEEVAPEDAVGYAFRAGDVKKARQLLMTLPPTVSLAQRIPPTRWERTLVEVRLGNVSFESFRKGVGATLRKDDWEFVMRYLPPGEASALLVSIADSLGIIALPHRVATRSITPQQLDQVCQEEKVQANSTEWETCGLGYIQVGDPSKALLFLRRVVMDHAGDDTALFMLWALEGTLGQRDGVDRIIQVIENPQQPCDGDPLCGMVQASRLSQTDPEKARRILEDILLSDVEEPLKNLARIFLERGIPPVDLWQQLASWLVYLRS